ncbi:hypothetical protein D3C75_1151600 [compost metagenome]
MVKEAELKAEGLAEEGRGPAEAVFQVDGLRWAWELVRHHHVGGPQVHMADALLVQRVQELKGAGD